MKRSKIFATSVKKVDVKPANARPMKNRTHLLIVVALSVLCYLNSLGCGLVFDDVPAVVQNQDLRPETPWSNVLQDDFWGTPLQKEESHKSYRPLCVLTFRINYVLHALKPLGYHLLNVVLHAVVCVLYYSFWLEFLQGTISLVAAALFSVHPIHTEAVSGVVGRAELLSAIFFLLALRSYVSASKAGTFQSVRVFVSFVVLVAFAMFSKEQGITVSGVCVLYDILLLLKRKFSSNASDRTPRGKAKGPTPTWRKDLVLRLLLVLAATGLLLFFRMKLMGGRMPVFNKFDNPAAVSPTPARQLTYHYLLSLNSWLLLCPCELCCDWTMGTVPVVTSLVDIRNVATVVLYLALFMMLKQVLQSRHEHAKRIAIGLCLLCIPFIPASNLFFPVGFVVAERVLYVPSMGFCFLVAYGWHCLLNVCGNRRWAKVMMWGGLMMILCLDAVKTVRRNFDWKDEEVLFTSGLRVAPQNAKLWNNLGHVMEERGDHERALEHFLKATEMEPGDIGGYLNSGIAYGKLGRTEMAEKAFWKAKSLLPQAKPGYRYRAHVAPKHLELFRHLGNLLAKNESRLEEAQQLYEEAISMKQDYIEAYLDRAGILIKLNRSREARDSYNQALKHDSMNPDIFYNIGVLLLEEGESEQALRHFDKALQLDPEHEKSLINYAILTQEAGNARLRRLAHERLQLLLHKGNLPPERIYFNMGMLAMEDREWTVAEDYFKRAIEHKQNFTSALFNMALLLHNQKRNLEAVPHLKRLLKHQEFHLKGLMLLGNIYFTDVKNFKAAKECYETILRRDPDYLAALHNLCAVYVQLNEFKTAEKCLVRASELAPSEAYIAEHLNIVRQHQERGKQLEPTPNKASGERAGCENAQRTEESSDDSDIPV